MSRTAQPRRLREGRVYRTRDLRRWGKNTARVAGELVATGQLVKLAGGLYASPRRSKFGPLPPSDDELMRAFLNDGPYVFTGPECWNPLGLGATAMFTSRLVYNTKRSGEFTFGNKRFALRRTSFPRKPSPEWFVVDLLENHAMAGVDLGTLEDHLTEALRAGRFDARRLERMAEEYGTRVTQALVLRAAGAMKK